MSRRIVTRATAVVRAFAVFTLALGCSSVMVEAQGVTSAAVEGRVTEPDGTPVSGATVRAVLVPSGSRWQVVTDASGRYFLENVEVGGPYIIEARGIGYAPARESGITLALGQRRRVSLTLRPAAVELSSV